VQARTSGQTLFLVKIPSAILRVKLPRLLFSPSISWIFGMVNFRTLNLRKIKNYQAIAMSLGVVSVLPSRL
jgi:hypothetical protein